MFTVINLNREQVLDLVKTVRFGAPIASAIAGAALRALKRNEPVQVGGTRYTINRPDVQQLLLSLPDYIDRED